jgi:hypothetical protein
MKVMNLLTLVLICGIGHSAELVKDGDAFAFVVTLQFIQGDKPEYSSGDKKYASLDELAKEMDEFYMSDKTGPGFYLRMRGPGLFKDVEQCGIDIRKKLKQHPEYSMLKAVVVVDGKEKDISDQVEKVNY